MLPELEKAVAEVVAAGAAAVAVKPATWVCRTEMVPCSAAPVASCWGTVVTSGLACPLSMLTWGMAQAINSRANKMIMVNLLLFLFIWILPRHPGSGWMFVMAGKCYPPLRFSLLYNQNTLLHNKIRFSPHSCATVGEAFKRSPTPAPPFTLPASKGGKGSSKCLILRRGIHQGNILVHGRIKKFHPVASPGLGLIKSLIGALDQMFRLDDDR